MTPHTIIGKLGQMRSREKLLRLIWGGALWLTLAVVLLSLCCALDWIVDRYNDTPGILFTLMIGLQVAAWTAAFVFLILLPMTRLLSDDDLTLAVEEGNPSLYHRLISALQLNRPEANIKGMSKELIDIVTREAEKEADRLDFTTVLDHRRLKWTGLVLGPLALVVVLLFILMPQTLPALLARQFGGDAEIPRSVEVTNVSRDVWPEGDEVTLEFAVKGKDVDESLVGKAIVQHLWGATNEYGLAYDRKVDGGAIFTARVPASFNDFTFRARVRDGRTRKDGNITFKPRPVVIGQVATVLRPTFVGLKPDGSRYEIEMEKGDISALPGHDARVVIRASKPVKKATLELLRSQGGDSDSVVERKPMKLFEEDRKAETTFEVTDKVTAYRVILVDEHGFSNSKAPQRTITLLPDELPLVTMLKDDRFLLARDKKVQDESDKEGMPLLIGFPIRVAYQCDAPYYGLREGYLKIRKNEDPNWTTHKLTQYVADEKAGPFNRERGVFANSGRQAQVDFHAMSSPDPNKEPGRLQGGGRFDYTIKGLKSGDVVEYYIEIYDQNPAKDRPPGISTPPLIKQVVDEDEFLKWQGASDREANALKSIIDRERKSSGINK